MELPKRFWGDSQTVWALAVLVLLVLGLAEHLLLEPGLVELGSVEIPVSAVLQMSEGDTLLLDSRPEHLLPMFVGGEHRFLCRPGTVGNQIGIRVHELVEEQVLDLSEFDEDEEDAESRAADEAGDDDRRVIDFPTPDETPAETEPSAIAGDGAAGELPDASLTAPIEEAASA